MLPAIETRALRKVYPAPPLRRRTTGGPLATLTTPGPQAADGAREILALDGLDLAVPPGEFFGLLGPNGAGKTTTIGVLTTRVRPTSGSASVAGIDVATDPVGVKQRIGVVPQRPNPDRQLTAIQNLLFHAAYFGIPRARPPPPRLPKHAPARPTPARQRTAIQNLLFPAAYFGIPRARSLPRGMPKYAAWKSRFWIAV